jgi:MazG family protein
MKAFQELVRVMQTLRGESGCPWNRAQDFSTLQSFLEEEAYESFAALREMARHPGREAAQRLAEELGDLSLQVVFLATVAEEAGWFTLSEVLTGITDKLKRRHPHVFSDAQAKTPAEVAELWERVKAEERRGKRSPQGALGGVPRAVPALVRAQKIGQKAAANRFDWENATGVWQKVNEELAELGEVIADGAPKAPAEHELGDVLFSLVQLARHLQLSAEDCLHGGIDRFLARFQKLEELVAADGLRLEDVSRERLEDYWNQAKSALAPSDR